jgi:hypothetical protein
MNMHKFRLKEINVPEAISWTPVEVPIEETAEQAAKRASNDVPGHHLLRRTYRIGQIGISKLVFLLLGATGLWAIVDLVKFVAEWRNEK